MQLPNVHPSVGVILEASTTDLADIRLQSLHAGGVKREMNLTVII